MLATLTVLGGGALFLADRFDRWRGRSRTTAVIPETVPSPAEASIDRASAVEPPREDTAMIGPRMGMALSAGAALGLSVGGGLTLIGLPLLAGALTGLTVRNWQDWREGRNRRIIVLDAVTVGGAIVTGRFLITAGLMFCVHLGVYVGRRTEDRARRAMTSSLLEQPKDVRVLRGDHEVVIPLADVVPGDIIRVEPGQVVPVDGVLLDGVALLDERAMTGESQPVEKLAGDPLLAATVVVRGQARIRVESTGEDCAAARIVRSLDATRDYRDEIRARGDQIVSAGVLPTMALGALTLPILGANAALAVLFSSFGYSVRITGPITVINHLDGALKGGVLVKDGRALELLAGIDTVVFDKTGTLTEDLPEVGGVHALADVEPQTLLRWTAAAERGQSHPIGRAIVAEAAARGLHVPGAGPLEVEPGRGLRVQVEGHDLCIGSPKLLRLQDIDLADERVQAVERGAAPAATIVWIAIDGRLAGWIELVPRIRPEARPLVRSLQARGLDVRILSGDRKAATGALADALGVNGWDAEVLPEGKADVVARLQADGRTVCYVGDGINDAIALKAATVSVSLSGATEVATDTASMILLDGSLRQFDAVFDISARLIRDLKVGTGISMTSGGVCLGGIYLAGFGFSAAIMLFNVSLVAGLLYAVRPWPEGVGGQMGTPTTRQPLGHGAG